MNNIIQIIGSIVFAYLIGSFPTAVLLSNHMANKDVRQMGDGNSGARNVNHMFGWRAGIIVGAVDFTKGMLAVLLAKIFGLSLDWQLVVGILAVVGHDFPIFAKFSGGQGMATSLGTMAILFPFETLFGLMIFALVYVFTKHFNISAGYGLGTLVFLLLIGKQSFIPVLYAVFLFLTIPLKKHLDSQYRKIK